MLANFGIQNNIKVIYVLQFTWAHVSFFLSFAVSFDLITRAVHVVL